MSSATFQPFLPYQSLQTYQPVEVTAETVARDMIDTSLAQVEGDWNLYRQRSGQLAHTDHESATNLQSRLKLALAYLGKRAQRCGGVFNSASPTVLTPALVEQLGTDNTTRRHTRYPWLAQLLAIAAELDREQHAHASISGTVLSFASHRSR